MNVVRPPEMHAFPVTVPSKFGKIKMPPRFRLFSSREKKKVGEHRRVKVVLESCHLLPTFCHDAGDFARQIVRLSPRRSLRVNSHSILCPARSSKTPSLLILAH